MEDELIKRVSEVEKEILRFKAIQKSQNDSAKYYAYQSNNLYGAYPDRTNLYIEFRPFVMKKENVICRFFAVEGYAVQYYTQVNMDPKNPLKASFFYMGASSLSGLPNFLKWAYVGCYTNCEGQLIIST